MVELWETEIVSEINLTSPSDITKQTHTAYVWKFDLIWTVLSLLKSNLWIKKKSLENTHVLKLFLINTTYCQWRQPGLSWITLERNYNLFSVPTRWVVPHKSIFHSAWSSMAPIVWECQADQRLQRCSTSGIYSTLKPGVKSEQIGEKRGKRQNLGILPISFFCMSGLQRANCASRTNMGSVWNL